MAKKQKCDWSPLTTLLRIEDGYRQAALSKYDAKHCEREWARQWFYGFAKPVINEWGSDGVQWMDRWAKDPDPYLRVHAWYIASLQFDDDNQHAFDAWERLGHAAVESSLFVGAFNDARRFDLRAGSDMPFNRFRDSAFKLCQDYCGSGVKLGRVYSITSTGLLEKSLPDNLMEQTHGKLSPQWFERLMRFSSMEVRNTLNVALSLNASLADAYQGLLKGGIVCADLPADITL